MCRLRSIGLVLTTAALIGATRSMNKGNRAQFNRMLRFRVAAQAFTVVGKSSSPCIRPLLHHTTYEHPPLIPLHVLLHFTQLHWEEVYGMVRNDGKKNKNRKHSI